VAGDVIVSLNGHPVAGIDDLHRLLGAEAIGAKLPITIVRGAEKRDLDIVPQDS
jgi:S1-C subfamily serine protease